MHGRMLRSPSEPMRATSDGAMPAAFSNESPSPVLPFENATASMPSSFGPPSAGIPLMPLAFTRPSTTALSSPPPKSNSSLAENHLPSAYPSGELQELMANLQQLRSQVTNVQNGVQEVQLQQQQPSPFASALYPPESSTSVRDGEATAFLSSPVAVAKAAEVSKALQGLFTPYHTIDTTTNSEARAEDGDEGKSMRGRSPPFTSVPLSSSPLLPSREGAASSSFPISVIPVGGPHTGTDGLHSSSTLVHILPTAEQWMEKKQKEESSALEILEAVRRSHEAQQEAVKLLLQKEEEKREHRKQQRLAERARKEEKKKQKRKAYEIRKEEKRQLRAAENAARGHPTGSGGEEDGADDDEDLSISFTVGGSTTSSSFHSSASSSAGPSSSSSSSGDSFSSELLHAIAPPSTVFPLNMENLSRFELQLELLREEQRKEQQQQPPHGKENGSGGGGPQTSSHHTKHRKDARRSKKMERFEEAITHAISALQDMPNASSDLSARLEGLLAKVNDSSVPTLLSPSAVEKETENKKSEEGGGEEDARHRAGSTSALSPLDPPFPDSTASVDSLTVKSSVLGLPTVILHPSPTRVHSTSLPSTNPILLPFTGVLVADPFFSELGRGDGDGPATLGQAALLKEVQSLQSTSHVLGQDMHRAGEEEVMERELREPIKGITHLLKDIIGEGNRADDGGNGGGGGGGGAEQDGAIPPLSTHPLRRFGSRASSTKGTEEKNKDEETAIIPLDRLCRVLSALQAEYDAYVEHNEAPERGVVEDWRERRVWCKEELTRLKERVEGAVQKAEEQRAAVRHHSSRNTLNPLQLRLNALLRHLAHLMADRETMVMVFNTFQKAVWDDTTQMNTLQRHWKEHPNGMGRVGNVVVEMEEGGRGEKKENGSGSSRRSSAMPALPESSFFTTSVSNPVSPTLLAEMQGRHDRHKAWVEKEKESLVALDALLTSTQREIEELLHANEVLVDLYAKDLHHEEEQMEKVAGWACLRLQNALEDFEELYALSEMVEERMRSMEEEEEEEEENEEEEEENEEEEEEKGASHSRKNTKNVTSTVHITETTRLQRKKAGWGEPPTSAPRDSYRPPSSSSASSRSVSTAVVEPTPVGRVAAPPSPPPPPPQTEMVEKILANHEKNMQDMMRHLEEEKLAHQQELEKVEKEKERELQRLREEEQHAREERDRATRALEEERRRQEEARQLAREEELRKELDDVKKVLVERQSKRDDKDDDDNNNEKKKAEKPRRRSSGGSSRSSGGKRMASDAVPPPNIEAERLRALEAEWKAKEIAYRLELERSEKKLEQERAEAREREWKAQKEREREEREQMSNRLHLLEEHFTSLKAEQTRDREAAKTAMDRELQREGEWKEEKRQQQQAWKEALEKQVEEKEKRMALAEREMQTERERQKESERLLLEKLEAARNTEDRQKMEELEQALATQQQEQIRALENAVKALEKERLLQQEQQWQLQVQIQQQQQQWEKEVAAVLATPPPPADAGVVETKSPRPISRSSSSSVSTALTSATSTSHLQKAKKNASTHKKTKKKEAPKAAGMEENERKKVEEWEEEVKKAQREGDHERAAVWQRALDELKTTHAQQLADKEAELRALRARLAEEQEKQQEEKKEREARRLQAAIAERVAAAASSSSSTTAREGEDTTRASGMEDTLGLPPPGGVRTGTVGRTPSNLASMGAGVAPSPLVRSALGELASSSSSSFAELLKQQQRHDDRVKKQLYVEVMGEKQRKANKEALLASRRPHPHADAAVGPHAASASSSSSFLAGETAAALRRLRHGRKPTTPSHSLEQELQRAAIQQEVGSLKEKHARDVANMERLLQAEESNAQEKAERKHQGEIRRMQVDLDETKERLRQAQRLLESGGGGGNPLLMRGSGSGNSSPYACGGSRRRPHRLPTAPFSPRVSSTSNFRATATSGGGGGGVPVGNSTKTSSSYPSLLPRLEEHERRKQKGAGGGGRWRWSVEVSKNAAAPPEGERDPASYSSRSLLRLGLYRRLPRHLKRRSSASSSSLLRADSRHRRHSNPPIRESGERRRLVLLKKSSGKAGKRNEEEDAGGEGGKKTKTKESYSRGWPVPPSVSPSRSSSSSSSLSSALSYPSHRNGEKKAKGARRLPFSRDLSPFRGGGGCGKTLPASSSTLLTDSYPSMVYLSPAAAAAAIAVAEMGKKKNSHQNSHHHSKTKQKKKKAKPSSSSSSSHPCHHPHIASIKESGKHHRLPSGEEEGGPTSPMLPLPPHSSPFSSAPLHHASSLPLPSSSSDTVLSSASGAAPMEAYHRPPSSVPPFTTAASGLDAYSILRPTEAGKRREANDDANRNGTPPHHQKKKKRQKTGGAEQEMGVYHHHTSSEPLPPSSSPDASDNVLRLDSRDGAHHHHTPTSPSPSSSSRCNGYPTTHSHTPRTPSYPYRPMREVTSSTHVQLPPFSNRTGGASQQEVSVTRVTHIPASSASTSMGSEGRTSSYEYHSVVTLDRASGTRRGEYTPSMRERAGVYTVVQGAKWLSDMYRKEPFYSKKVENSVEELGSMDLLTPHRRQMHSSSKIPSPLFSGTPNTDNMDGIPLSQRFHRDSPGSLRSGSGSKMSRERITPSPVHYVTPIPRRNPHQSASQMQPATP